MDIWSCGVILFALICGYLPFEDPNTSNLYKKIINGEFNIPRAASESARDMIKNILQTNPEIRYRVQEIRKHPWYTSQQLGKITGGIFIGFTQIPSQETFNRKRSKIKSLTTNIRQTRQNLRKRNRNETWR